MPGQSWCGVAWHGAPLSQQPQPRTICNNKQTGLAYQRRQIWNEETFVSFVQSIHFNARLLS